MSVFLKAFAAFGIGILKRSYFWLFAIFLDPFDVYSRFKPTMWPVINIPVWLFWAVLGGLFFLTAFLTYLDVWRIANRRIIERISLVDFAELAKRKYGWKLGDDSLESLDLTYGIRQAAIIGIITLEGREGPHGIPQDLNAINPLVPVGVDTLAQAYIEVPGFFEAGVENFYTKIRDPSGDPIEKYRDIHISDKVEAIDWLRNEGPKLKGEQERLNEIEKERHRVTKQR